MCFFFFMLPLPPNFTRTDTLFPYPTRFRCLVEDLEKKRDLSQLVDLAGDAEGVRIFIGSENQLFGLSGSSLIISPYMNSQQKVVGVLGVVGPTRINYEIGRAHV